MTYKPTLYLNKSDNHFGHVCIEPVPRGKKHLIYAKWNGYTIYDCSEDLPDHILSDLDEQCKKQQKAFDESGKERWLK